MAHYHQPTFEDDDESQTPWSSTSAIHPSWKDGSVASAYSGASTDFGQGGPAGGTSATSTYYLESRSHLGDKSGSLEQSQQAGHAHTFPDPPDFLPPNFLEGIPPDIKPIDTTSRCCPDCHIGVLRLIGRKDNGILYPPFLDYFLPQDVVCAAMGGRVEYEILHYECANCRKYFYEWPCNLKFTIRTRDLDQHATGFLNRLWGRIRTFFNDIFPTYGFVQLPPPTLEEILELGSRQCQQYNSEQFSSYWPTNDSQPERPGPQFHQERTVPGNATFQTTVHVSRDTGVATLPQHLNLDDPQPLVGLYMGANEPEASAYELPIDGSSSTTTKGNNANDIGRNNRGRARNMDHKNFIGARREGACLRHKAKHAKCDCWKKKSGDQGPSTQQTP